MSQLDWSPWRPLTECLGRGVVSAEPGLYRIRGRGDAVLAYVGQTGRSLRERLRALRGVYGAEMPYRDPHTAAPALWAWLQTSPVELEASVAPVPGSAVERKGLEAVVIALHRQQHQRSPRWNFGRMPPGFSMSSGNTAPLAAAGKRFRGGATAVALAQHAPGVPPRGSLDSDVRGSAWCGHAWSMWRPMTRAEIAYVPPSSGLYRVRGWGLGLVYVGEGRIRNRLRAHVGKLDEPTQQGAVFREAGPLSFSLAVDDALLSHQRLELETDLIAAHTFAHRTPPTAQFIG